MEFLTLAMPYLAIATVVAIGYVVGYERGYEVGKRWAQR